MRKIELRYKIITGRGHGLAAGFGLSYRFDIDLSETIFTYRIIHNNNCPY